MPELLMWKVRIGAWKFTFRRDSMLMLMLLPRGSHWKIATFLPVFSKLNVHMNLLVILLQCIQNTWGPCENADSYSVNVVMPISLLVWIHLSYHSFLHENNWIKLESTGWGKDCEGEKSKRLKWGLSSERRCHAKGKLNQLHSWPFCHFFPQVVWNVDFLMVYIAYI